MKRQRMLALAIIILLITAGWLVSSYIGSYQKLTVRPDGVTANIYKAGSSQLVKSANAAKTFRLKKGNYVVSSAANPDFSSFSQPVTLGDQPESLNVNPDYSEQKIKTILATEQTVIDGIISQKYPNYSQFFKIGRQELYNRGQYYGAKLFPLDESTYDRRGILMKRSGDSWEIITNPPPIFISGPLYPEVPRWVIAAVNGLN